MGYLFWYLILCIKMISCKIFILGNRGRIWEIGNSKQGSRKMGNQPPGVPPQLIERGTTLISRVFLAYLKHIAVPQWAKNSLPWSRDIQEQGWAGGGSSAAFFFVVCGLFLSLSAFSFFRCLRSFSFVGCERTWFFRK